MFIYRSNTPMKIAELNRQNWTKTTIRGNTATYTHKQRRNVQLKLDTTTKIGFFWDKKTRKPISRAKRIIWFN